MDPQTANLADRFKNDIDFTIEFITRNNPLAVRENLAEAGFYSSTEGETAAVLRALYKVGHIKTVGKCIAVPFIYEAVPVQSREIVATALKSIKEPQNN